MVWGLSIQKVKAVNLRTQGVSWLRRTYVRTALAAAADASAVVVGDHPLFTLPLPHRPPPQEWNLACLFDKRYVDPEWVRTNKHWPPRMIAALQKFLSLS